MPTTGVDLHGDGYVRLALYIVRHGETLANREGIIQGQSESPLSDLGLAQAELVHNALADEEWWWVVSSDLGRCRSTAEIIIGQNFPVEPETRRTTEKSAPKSGDASFAQEMIVSGVRVDLDSRLREMSAGVYEGLPRGTAADEAIVRKLLFAVLSTASQIVRALGLRCIYLRLCYLPTVHREHMQRQRGCQ
eukprot:SAG31_NODE_12_length_38498_cov_21.161671_36_plen_192_part_00